MKRRANSARKPRGKSPACLLEAKKAGKKTQAPARKHHFLPPSLHSSGGLQTGQGSSRRQLEFPKNSKQLYDNKNNFDFINECVK